MHVDPHILSPLGHAQPPVVQISPPVHGAPPLHVHVPIEHVFVVVPAQSLLVQHSPDGMHVPSHSDWPDGHAQPADVQVSPPPHGIEPLHVHVPPLHVLVVPPVQSLAVQHSPDGMQTVPHIV